MPDKNFDKNYKLLNPEQKEAVDTIEGPVMVIAGPGTGKTQILTLRIANILKMTDTSPGNILALTFTESATYGMRRRLTEIIGSSSYRVNIFTFHGFCNDLIKRYPEYFPRIIGSRNIVKIDQIKIIGKVLEKTELTMLRPYGAPLYYLHSIIQSIGTLKKENISPTEFSKIIQQKDKEFYNIDDLHHESGVHEGKMKAKYLPIEKQIKKNKELALVYASYEKELEKQKLYDYDDMIMEVIRTLVENRDLLSALQEEYQYILVDEHQDTNSAQNKVIELLCNFYDAPNLFVVGDEKQAIFRFQGADLNNFFYFRDLYPKAKLINLETNYRSTQSILDSAHSLISKSSDGFAEFRKNLTSIGNYSEEKIKLFEFRESDFEYRFLAEDIIEKIKDGVPAKEIAILYRDNKDVFNIIKALEKREVKYVVESDENLFADKDIQKLVLMFRAINNYGDDEYLLQMLHLDFFDIKSLDIYKLVDYRSKNKGKHLLDAIRQVDVMESIGIEESKKIYDLYDKFSHWHNLEHNQNLADFFNFVVNNSGFIQHVLNSATPIDKMNKLNGFFNEVKTLVEGNRKARLKDFIEYLDLLEEHNVLIKKIGKGSDNSLKIKLMTAHRSKGLEFDYVYIVNAYDTHWGNRRNADPLKLLISKNILNSEADNSDERRLFYVALTRGRKGVIITYAKKSEDDKDQLRSQFIEEIGADLISVGDSSKYESLFAKDNINKFEVSKSKPESLKDKEYLNNLFIDHGLSVTALNNYLDCPWKYFYNNLVRIPTAIEKTQMYGIAVHSALKDFFDKWKTGENVGKGLLIDLFKSNISKQPLSEKDLEDSIEKGARALSGYYDEYHETWGREILNEFNVPGVIIAPNVMINGKIDKLEKLKIGGDGVNEVIVYDYKTAKPKSRNEIEGKTKNADGNYKRQLVFYNILLNHYGLAKSSEKGERYKMMQGVIDFIEPDEKSDGTLQYKREAFIIRDEEILELTELIKKVANEILNLEFWGKRCNDKKCKYCKLREMMR